MRAIRRRASPGGAYATLPTWGWKTRICPKCKAERGHRCWSLSRTLYPVRQTKPHDERREGAQ